MQLTCICGDNFPAKYKHLSAGEFWDSKTVYCFFGTHNLGWKGQSGLLTVYDGAHGIAGNKPDLEKRMVMASSWTSARTFGKYGVAFSAAFR